MFVFRYVLFTIVVGEIAWSCSSVAGPLYDPLVPEQIEVYTVGKDTRDYFRSLKVIEIDPSPNIRSRFRNKFDANVAFFEDGRPTFSNAKIRIAGDWKDHVDTRRNISSLLVQLINSSIGNIVKFRLLLPHTKKGVHEIFMSVLMEELGFPVPFRRMVNVTMNDVIHYRAIFEESPEKEFIERFGFRESPIVELDERQIWANRNWTFHADYCLAKNGNNQCQNEDLPFTSSHKVDNAAFLKNSNSIIVGLKALNISNIFGNETFDAVTGKYAAHTLVDHNRKFLYDPMYGEHWPIYFDGEVSLDECVSDPDAWKDAVEDVRVRYDRIAWKYSARTGESLNGKQECAAKSVLLSVSSLSSSRDVKFHNIGKVEFGQFSPLQNDVTPEIVGFDPKDNLVKKCRLSADKKVLRSCQTLSFEEQRVYVAGNGKPFLHGVYEVFPAVVGKLYEGEVLFSEKKHIDVPTSVKRLRIPANSTYFLRLSDGHAHLSIVLEDPVSSRVVLYQSNLSRKLRLNVRADISSGSSEDSVRYDEQLLTSCATIVDSMFDGGEIFVEGGGCEDSLNFIRTNGFIKTINVNDAAHDAIDADFSRLDIKEITVRNAGNDCLDLSSGYYNFADLFLSGCGDKAVSVGERSRVTINSATISTSNVGVAVKDSSTVHLDSIQADTSSVKLCLDAYRKKQEYRGGTAVINKGIECNKKHVDTYSNIELNPDLVCLHMAEFNGVEVCSRENGIRYQHRFARPLRYEWRLRYYTKEQSKDMNTVIEENARECIGKVECQFDVPWASVPSGYLTGESLGDHRKMAEVYVDLDRLGYAK